MEKKTDLLKKAAKLGTQAFKDGKGVAPALSKELCSMLVGQDHKTSMILMHTYTNAWIKANLAEPIYMDGECINPWVLNNSSKVK